MRHLTSLAMSGVRHTLQSRELLARILVSSLPLLLHLDLSLQIYVNKDRNQDQLIESNIVTTKEHIEQPGLATFLDVLGGKFAKGLASLSLAGRRYLDSAALRRLLLFEARSLLSLSLNNCELKNPSVVLSSVGTCVRLKKLSLRSAFSNSTSWIATEDMHELTRRLTKLTHLDVRGIQPVSGPDALSCILVNCQALSTLKSEMKYDDTSLLLLSTLEQLKTLNLCSSRAFTGARIEGISVQGFKDGINHGIANHLESLSLGGSAGPGICDASLAVTLSLATSLTTLQLNGCARISDVTFERVGEGRGLVGIFVSDSFKSVQSTIDSTNSMISRIDSVPPSIMERLRGKYKRLHRGECYQYMVPTNDDDWNDDQNSATPLIAICRSGDGRCSHCPPSGSFEKMDLTLHSYEWRCRASSMLLTTVTLSKCPRITDRGVRLLLCRTPLLTSLCLADLPMVRDFVTAHKGHFSAGEDRLVGDCLCQLTSLSLLRLRSLSQHFIQGCISLFGFVDDCEDIFFRTRSISPMKSLTLDDLPMFPSSSIAKLVRCFPLLVSLDVSRVSFDGRILKALDLVCARLVTLRLYDLNVTQRPRLHAKPLAKFLTRRSDTLRRFVISNINYISSAGAVEEDGGGGDGESESESEGDEEKIRYEHYSLFLNYLRGCPVVLQRIRIGDDAEQCFGVSSGRPGGAVQEVMAGVVEEKDVNDNDDEDDSYLLSLQLLKQRQKERKKIQALQRATKGRKREEERLKSTSSNK